MLNTAAILYEHLNAEQKYLAGAALCAAMLVSFLLVQLCFSIYERMKEKEGNGWLKAILTILIFCAVSAYGIWFTLNRSIPAKKEAEQSLLSTEAVMVHPMDYGWFFDGWGSADAMIFYGEENIETEAYAPLLYQCARQGLDCFLIRMPYQRAYLNENAADEILHHYDYYRWYMGAHGNGSESAENYANTHADQLEGMILFGAYPKQLDSQLRLIAIYGEKDGLFDYDGYETAKQNFPADTREAVIKGANHSGFGSYEKPELDHTAQITASLQQMLASEMVRMALIAAD